MYGYINKKSWKARPCIFFLRRFSCWCCWRWWWWYVLVLLLVSVKRKKKFMIIWRYSSLSSSAVLMALCICILWKWWWWWDERAASLSVQKNIEYYLHLPYVRIYKSTWPSSSSSSSHHRHPSIHHHHIIIQRSSRTKNHQCFYSIQPIRPFHPLLIFDKTFILLFFLDITVFFFTSLSMPALTLLSCYSSSFSWWSWSSSSSRQIFNYGGCTSKTYIIDSSSRFLFLRLTE